ncbi:unnamed protein product [Rhizoctonia solani]|uniref:Uncharacterized protein n=1 Tax=Rhizoctonia solani TaxID=456999 RepID=A0A8H2Y2P6_9AGAM|nr:unnamed protein product [Rhizoctonia solani]
MAVRKLTASVSSATYARRVSNIDEPDTLGVDGDGGRALAVAVLFEVVLGGLLIVLLALPPALGPVRPDMVGNGRLGKLAIKVVVLCEGSPLSSCFKSSIANTSLPSCAAGGSLTAQAALLPAFHLPLRDKRLLIYAHYQLLALSLGLTSGPRRAALLRYRRPIDPTVGIDEEEPQQPHHRRRHEAPSTLFRLASSSYLRGHPV